MENNLILSKESSESEIKAYFNAVLKLSQSDDEFPVNLDEVWPLVYSEKGKAVRALTSNEQFIEGVDYKTLAQNGKQDEVSWGGSNKIDYKLTVSCMEFFIARKVRPVFEVYRQVFHKVAKQELSRKELALMVIQAEEEKERLLLENNHLSETVELQTKELQKSAPKVTYYDTHLQSVNALTATQIAKEIGMSAEKLNSKLKELGIQFKQSGEWLLKSPYDKWGMHETRTNIFTSERGNTHTNTYTVWTQKGRRFIIALYENDWDVKKAIRQIKGELEPAA